MSDFHTANDLVERLVAALRAESRPVAFLLGSPLSAPTAGTRGVPTVRRVTEMVKEELGLPPSHVMEYQDAFEMLNTRRGPDACNRLVRRATLEAFDTSQISPEALQRAITGDIEMCRRLERMHDAWYIPPGMNALAQSIALHPERLGRLIMTSNFDPLIEVALRRAGHSSHYTILTGEGNIEQSHGEGTHVIHVHGYWGYADTLHSKRQLEQPRTQLRSCLRRVLEKHTLVTVGYGGWSDIFTKTIAEVIKDQGSAVEILWTFYSNNESTIRREHSRVLRLLTPGMRSGRVSLFLGVDCNQVLPQVHGRLTALVSEPATSADPARASERLSVISAEQAETPGDEEDEDEDEDEKGELPIFEVGSAAAPPTSRHLRIPLEAQGLFGNDAAEDEDEEIFNSYLYSRPELRRVVDPKEKILLLRAYKGEGKSALLRAATTELAQSKDLASFSIPAPQIAPDADRSRSFDEWVREWQRNILWFVANRLVPPDHQIPKKEDAFKSAFLGNIGSIKSLLQQLTGFSSFRLSDDANIWLMLDDIDRNFQRTDEFKIHVAACLDACRYLSKQIPQLRFRLAIRPNIWTIVQMTHEGMSHFSQYAIDIAWSEIDILALLARRIEGFLARSGQRYPAKRDEELLSLVFESPVQWGGKFRDAHVMLDTLSMHRPRWLIDLCKQAAESASERQNDLILKRDVTRVMGKFGDKRISDIVAEFKPHCAVIDELIAAFRGQAEQYRTDELMTLIERRILSHVTPTIIGSGSRARDVAQFLFYAGFLTARKERKDGSYEHYSYRLAPDLLSRTNLDGGVRWEIPPIFRQALGIRGSEGSPLDSQKNRRVRL